MLARISCQNMKVLIPVLLLQIGYVFGCSYRISNCYGNNKSSAPCSCIVSNNFWSWPRSSHDISESLTQGTLATQSYVNCKSQNPIYGSTIFSNNGEHATTTHLGDDTNEPRRAPGHLVVNSCDHFGKIKTDYWSWLQCLPFYHHYPTEFHVKEVQALSKDGNGSPDYFYADLKLKDLKEQQEDSDANEVQMYGLNNQATTHNSILMDYSNGKGSFNPNLNDNEENSNHFAIATKAFNYGDDINNDKLESIFPTKQFVVNIPPYHYGNCPDIWRTIKSSPSCFQYYTCSNGDSTKLSNSYSFNSFHSNRNLYTNQDNHNILRYHKDLNSNQNVITPVKHVDVNAKGLETKVFYVDIPPWDIITGYPDEVICPSSFLQSSTTQSQGPRSQGSQNKVLSELQNQSPFFKTMSLIQSSNSYTQLSSNMLNKPNAQSLSLQTPSTQNHFFTPKNPYSVTQVKEILAPSDLHTKNPYFWRVDLLEPNPEISTYLSDNDVALGGFPQISQPITRTSYLQAPSLQISPVKGSELRTMTSIPQFTASYPSYPYIISEPYPTTPMSQNSGSVESYNSPESYLLKSPGTMAGGSFKNTPKLSPEQMSMFGYDSHDLSPSEPDLRYITTDPDSIHRHICPVNPRPGYICPLNFIPDPFSSLIPCSYQGESSKIQSEYVDPNHSYSVFKKSYDYPVGKLSSGRNNFQTSGIKPCHVCPANPEPGYVCPLSGIGPREVLNSNLPKVGEVFPVCYRPSVSYQNQAETPENYDYSRIYKYDSHNINSLYNVYSPTSDPLMSLIEKPPPLPTIPYRSTTNQLTDSQLATTQSTSTIMPFVKVRIPFSKSLGHRRPPNLQTFSNSNTPYQQFPMISNDGMLPQFSNNADYIMSSSFSQIPNGLTNNNFPITESARTQTNYWTERVARRLTNLSTSSNRMDSSLPLTLKDADSISTEPSIASDANTLTPSHRIHDINFQHLSTAYQDNRRPYEIPNTSAGFRPSKFPDLNSYGSYEYPTIQGASINYPSDFITMPDSSTPSQFSCMPTQSSLKSDTTMPSHFPMMPNDQLPTTQLSAMINGNNPSQYAMIPNYSSTSQLLTVPSNNEQSQLNTFTDGGTTLNFHQIQVDNTPSLMFSRPYTGWLSRISTLPVCARQPQSILMPDVTMTQYPITLDDIASRHHLAAPCASIQSQIQIQKPVSQTSIMTDAQSLNPPMSDRSTYPTLQGNSVLSQYPKNPILSPLFQNPIIPRVSTLSKSGWLSHNPIMPLDSTLFQYPTEHDGTMSSQDPTILVDSMLSQNPTLLQEITSSPYSTMQGFSAQLPHNSIVSQYQTSPYNSVLYQNPTMTDHSTFSPDAVMSNNNALHLSTTTPHGNTVLRFSSMPHGNEIIQHSEMLDSSVMYLNPTVLDSGIKSQSPTIIESSALIHNPTKPGISIIPYPPMQGNNELSQNPAMPDNSMIPQYPLIPDAGIFTQYPTIPQSSALCYNLRLPDSRMMSQRSPIPEVGTLTQYPTMSQFSASIYNPTLPDNSMISQYPPISDGTVSQYSSIQGGGMFPQNPTMAKSSALFYNPGWVYNPQYPPIPDGGMLTQYPTIPQSSSLFYNPEIPDNSKISQHSPLPNGVIPQYLSKSNGGMLPQYQIMPKYSKFFYNSTIADNSMISQFPPISDRGKFAQYPIMPKTTALFHNPIIPECSVILQYPTTPESYTLFNNPTMPYNTLTSNYATLLESSALPHSPIILDNSMASQYPSIPDDVVLPQYPIISKTNDLFHNPARPENIMAPQYPPISDGGMLTQYPTMPQSGALLFNPTLPDYSMLYPPIPDGGILTQYPTMPQFSASFYNPTLPNNIMISQYPPIPEDGMLTQNPTMSQSSALFHISTTADNSILSQFPPITDYGMLPQYPTMPKASAKPEYSIISQYPTAPESSTLFNHPTMPDNTLICNYLTLIESSALSHNPKMTDNSLMTKYTPMQDDDMFSQYLLPKTYSLSYNPTMPHKRVITKYPPLKNDDLLSQYPTMPHYSALPHKTTMPYNSMILQYPSIPDGIMLPHYPAISKTSDLFHNPTRPENMMISQDPPIPDGGKSTLCPTMPQSSALFYSTSLPNIGILHPPIPDTVMTMLTEYPTMPQSSALFYKPPLQENGMIPQSPSIPDGGMLTQYPTTPQSSALFYNPTLPDNTMQYPSIPDGGMLTQYPTMPLSSALFYNPTLQENGMIPQSTPIPYSVMLTQYPTTPQSSALFYNPTLPDNTMQYPSIPDGGMLTQYPAMPQSSASFYNPTLPDNSMITQSPSIPDGGMLTQYPTTPQSSALFYNPTLPDNTMQYPPIPVGGILTQYPTMPLSSALLYNPTLQENGMIPQSTPIPDVGMLAQFPTMPQSSALFYNPTLPDNSMIPQYPSIPGDDMLTQYPTTPQSSALFCNPTLPDNTMQYPPIPDGGMITQYPTMLQSSALFYNPALSDSSMIPQYPPIPDCGMLTQYPTMPQSSASFYNPTLPDNSIIPQYPSIPDSGMLTQYPTMPQSSALFDNPTQRENNIIPQSPPISDGGVLNQYPTMPQTNVLFYNPKMPDNSMQYSPIPDGGMLTQYPTIPQSSTLFCKPTMPENNMMTKYPPMSVGGMVSQNSMPEPNALFQDSTTPNSGMLSRTLSVPSDSLLLQNSQSSPSQSISHSGRLSQLLLQDRFPLSQYSTISGHDTLPQSSIMHDRMLVWPSEGRQFMSIKLDGRGRNTLPNDNITPQFTSMTDGRTHSHSEIMASDDGISLLLEGTVPSQFSTMPCSSTPFQFTSRLDNKPQQTSIMTNDNFEPIQYPNVLEEHTTPQYSTTPYSEIRSELPITCNRSRLSQFLFATSPSPPPITPGDNMPLNFFTTLQSTPTKIESCTSSQFSTTPDDKMRTIATNGQQSYRSTTMQEGSLPYQFPEFRLMPETFRTSNGDKPWSLIQFTKNTDTSSASKYAAMSRKEELNRWTKTPKTALLSQTAFNHFMTSADQDDILNSQNENTKQNQVLNYFWRENRPQEWVNLGSTFKYNLPSNLGYPERPPIQYPSDITRNTVFLSDISQNAAYGPNSKSKSSESWSQSSTSQFYLNPMSYQGWTDENMAQGWTDENKALNPYSADVYQSQPSDFVPPPISSSFQPFVPYYKTYLDNIPEASPYTEKSPNIPGNNKQKLISAISSRTYYTSTPTTYLENVWTESPSQYLSPSESSIESYSTMPKSSVYPEIYSATSDEIARSGSIYSSASINYPYNMPDYEKAHFYLPYNSMSYKLKDTQRKLTLQNTEQNIRLSDLNSLPVVNSELADLETVLRDLPSKLKVDLQHFVTNKLDNIKNELLETNRFTTKLNNICYAKYTPNTGVVFRTDDPKILLKMWYSFNRILRCTLNFETEDVKTLNFIPIVDPKYIPYFQNPDVVQDIANGYITKYFSQPYVVKGIFSAENPYAAINLDCIRNLGITNRNFGNTDAFSVLWPTYCTCGCGKAGCRCQWNS